MAWRKVFWPLSVGYQLAFKIILKLKGAAL